MNRVSRDLCASHELLTLPIGISTPATAFDALIAAKAVRPIDSFVRTMPRSPDEPSSASVCAEYSACFHPMR